MTKSALISGRRSYWAARPLSGVESGGSLPHRPWRFRDLTLATFLLDAVCCPDQIGKGLAGACRLRAHHFGGDLLGGQRRSRLPHLIHSPFRLSICVVVPALTDGGLVHVAGALCPLGQLQHMGRTRADAWRAQARVIRERPRKKIATSVRS